MRKTIAGTLVSLLSLLFILSGCSNGLSVTPTDPNDKPGDLQYLPECVTIKKQYNGAITQDGPSDLYCRQKR